MASLKETITWADYESALRAAIGVASGEDDDLQDLLEAATYAGDQYFGEGYWVDDDGEDIAQSRGVLRGLWVWCAVTRAEDPTMQGAAQLVKPGVKQVKVGDNMVTYQTAAELVTVGEIALQAAERWWSRYREKFVVSTWEGIE